MSRAPKAVLFLLVLGVLPGLSVAADVAQVPSGTWAPAGEMALAREGASAVLLADGRVLVTGGRGPAGASAGAELYNPATGAFAAAGSMRVARSGHTSVLLEGGRVLVAGGVSGARPLASAEIYDPRTNTWTTAANMTEPRGGHTATVLANGRVLVAGGEGPQGATASLEIFDPAARVFGAAGALSSPRRAHAAALLADGRVLIVGGSNGTASLASTDVFDPATGRVTPGPTLSTPRAGASATTLLGGKILIAGGNDGSADLASAEMYDPGEKTFSGIAGSLVAARTGHLAFRLPLNNQVLIVGGTSGGVTVTAAELFSPWSAEFVPTGPLRAERAGAAGTPLRRAGQLLLAGGAGLASAEVYAFATLKTDKADNVAGEPVTVTGSGWQPGETVTLVLREVPRLHEDRTGTAVADAAGNILSKAFVAEPHDVPVRFYVTASGATSQAQTTFTASLAPAPVSDTTPAAASAGGPGAKTPGAPMAAPPVAIADPVTPTPGYTDRTRTDFRAGQPGECLVAEDAADGAVILKPRLLEEFAGGAIGKAWETPTWAAGGTIAISGGHLRLDGARAHPKVKMTGPRTMEFQAFFTAAPRQSGGFAANSDGFPWAVFATNDRGTALLARTDDGAGGKAETNLGAAFLGSSHRYRVAWTAAKVEYYVDDRLAASHAVAITAQMWPRLSDFGLAGEALSVNWLRVGPHAARCQFYSRPFDAGSAVKWESVSYESKTPTGTRLLIEVRSGNSANPADGTWSSFVRGPAFALTGRYAQYRATLSTTDPSRSPELSGATLTPSAAVDAAPAGETAVPPAGAATSPAGASVPEAEETPPTPTSDAPLPPFVPGVATDDTVADFGLGTPGACRIVAHTGDADGEVIQQPTVINDFDGLAGWEMVPWAPTGGATFTGGQIHVDGARVNTVEYYGPPRTLEFKATFRSVPFQHIGFGDTLQSGPWAIFSTRAGTTDLWARSNPGIGLEQETNLGPGYLDTPHYYRIEWTAASVTYYVDDVPRATHAVSIVNMRPILSDLFVGDGVLSADWVRMSPFAPDCTFTSRVFDAGMVALWTNFTSDQREPAGTSITVCVRTGNTTPPTGPERCEALGGAGPIGNIGRYAQYTAVLVSTDPNRMRTPELHSVTLNYVPVCQGVTCPNDGNVCTLDVCNPEDGTCGLPVASGTVCRAVAGTCDVAETCDGTVCPDDGFEPSSTQCRDSAGVCDVAESCTGEGPACPADGFEPTTTECRASADVCDVAESCTGAEAECPADGFEPATTTCRASADVCDVAESCSGTSAACPTDAFLPTTTTCRASAGICDVAESCTGAAAACPTDGFQPSSTGCRASAGICDAAESCTGSSATCPGDVFLPPSTECRASVGTCDARESCTGSSAECPVDGFAPATTQCRGAAGICDAAETCTGISNACPADRFAPATTQCRGAAGICDVAESCTGGAAACPADAFAPTTTQCRAASGQCDQADSCTGTSPTACPDVRAPDGTSCNDGSFCTATDRCAGGACTGTGNPCRDTNVCTPDKCDEGTDRCVYNQMCDDDNDGEDDDCDGERDEEDYDRNGDKPDGHDDDACDDDEDERSRVCILKTTGGGKTHNGSEFGFNAKGVIGSWANGQFNYRGGSARIHGRVTKILDAYETPDGGVMKFEVTTSNGSKYHVTVEDHGEPGQNRDAVMIHKVSGSGATPNTPARQVVRSGNVQWHPELDEDDDD